MRIISKASLRLGFGGGGTDLSNYCDIYGGCVINATINMFITCIIDEAKDKIIFRALDRNEEVVYGINEEFVYDGVLDIHKKVYEMVINEYCNGERSPMVITTYADASAGSGLGSSSTLTVAILKALTEWFNLPLGEYDAAHLSVRIEREELKLDGGKQDQFAATFGGFNFIEFYKDKVIVNPLRIKNWIVNNLESSVILYNTGTVRKSANIIKKQIASVSSSKDSIEAMHELKRSAYILKEMLLKGDIEAFAKALGASWAAKKRSSSAISTAHIDEIYESGINAGAYAAKVSGAGGGGYMIFICDPIKVPSVIKALKQFGGEIGRPQFTHRGVQCWKIY